MQDCTNCKKGSIELICTTCRSLICKKCRPKHSSVDCYLDVPQNYFLRLLCVKQENFEDHLDALKIIKEKREEYKKKLKCPSLEQDNKDKVEKEVKRMKDHIKSIKGIKKRFKELEEEIKRDEKIKDPKKILSELMQPNDNIPSFKFNKDVKRILKKDKELLEEANNAQIEFKNCFEKCIDSWIHKVKKAAKKYTKKAKKNEKPLEELKKKEEIYANKEEEHKKTMIEGSNQQVELDQKNKELEEENIKLSNNNMKLKKKKVKFDKILKNIKSDKEKLIGEFTSKQNELQDLKEQTAKMNEKKTEIDKQHKKKVSELNDATAKLKLHEETRKEFDLATGELNKIRLEMAKQNSELEGLTKKCSEKKKENDKLNSEEAKVKKSLDDIEAEKKKLIKEYNQLDATLKDLKDFIEAYKKDKSNIERETCSLKKKLSDLKSEASYWENECNKKRDEYNGLPVNIKHTRDESDILEKKIRNQREKFIENNKIELKKYKDHMKQKITDLKNKYNKFLEEHKELKNNYKLQSTELNHLNKQLENVDPKIDELKRQIDQTKSLKEKYNKEKQQHIDQINNLKSRLASRNYVFYYTLKNIKANKKEMKELIKKINNSFNVYKSTFSMDILEMVKGIKAQREGITNAIERIKILCGELTGKLDPEDLLDDNSTTQLRLEGRDMSALYNFIENVTRMMLHAYNKAKHEREIKGLNASHNKSGVDKIIKEYENDRKIALATIDSLLGQEKLSYELYGYTQSNSELIRKIKILGDVKDKLMRENEIIKEQLEKALEQQKDNSRQSHYGFQRRGGSLKIEDHVTTEIKTLKERNSKLEARYQNYISKLKSTKQSIMFSFVNDTKKKVKNAIETYKEGIVSALKAFKSKRELKIKKPLQHLRNDHIKVNKETFINKVRVAVGRLQHIISKNNKEIYSKLNIRIKTYDLLKLKFDELKQKKERKAVVKKEFEIDHYIVADYTELEEDNEEIKTIYKGKSKT